jgi:hypothetical protein
MVAAVTAKCRSTRQLRLTLDAAAPESIDVPDFADPRLTVDQALRTLARRQLLRGPVERLLDEPRIAIDQSVPDDPDQFETPLRAGDSWEKVESHLREGRAVEISIARSYEGG